MNVTKIIGISGKKQAGKDTNANFILGYEMTSLNLISSYEIDEFGKLRVPCETDDGVRYGIFPANPYDPEYVAWAAEKVDPFIRIYGFGDHVKNFCANYLGVDLALMNGTDKEKNSPTTIPWKSMPAEIQRLWRKRNKEAKVEDYEFMTVRDTMQYVGGTLIRSLNPKAYIDFLMGQIDYEQPELAVIKDVRDPLEIDAIHDKGGKVIRLPRNPLNDLHESETALDDGNYDQSKFDLIAPDGTIEEVGKAVLEWLTKTE